MVESARHARRPARRAFAVLGLVVAIVATAVAGTLFAVTERLGENIPRIPDPFTALDPATRPAPSAVMTFLVVGTDSRSTEPTTGEDATGPSFVPGAQRGDIVMLAQVSADRQNWRSTCVGCTGSRWPSSAPRSGGMGTEGTQSVVLLDDARAAALWAVLRDGTPAAYALQHPDDLLGPTPV